MREIILGKEECYDAKKELCIPFTKGTDVYDNIPLKLGNMVSGFPIIIDGITYPSSEILYLCGEFSNPTENHLAIQNMLKQETNAFLAKKMIKNKHKNEIRTDFNDFSKQWMLWVVWQKTIQNKEFQNILTSLPKDGIIIEDSSFQTSPTAIVWGCKNKERRRYKMQITKVFSLQGDTMGMKWTKAHVESEVNSRMMQYPALSAGIYKGQNNMGKILMLCKQALESNSKPPIDTDLLNRSNIYLLGKKLVVERQ